ncbi:MAG TPA: PilZ domain-containing protein [Gemmataceae bacterium]|nr:PilZ domain-containing protein [Gemmataceae bacterium]
MTETQPSPEGDLRGPRSGGRPAVERRRSRRRACRSAPALSYVPWPGELGQLGHAVDVGPQGIGFLATRPLRPGAVLALQVLGGAPGTSRTRVARVVHCAGGEGGQWRVGCQVSPPFSPEEVASLA